MSNFIFTMLRNNMGEKYILLSDVINFLASQPNIDEAKKNLEKLLYE